LLSPALAASVNAPSATTAIPPRLMAVSSPACLDQTCCPRPLNSAGGSQIPHLSRTAFLPRVPRARNNRDGLANLPKFQFNAQSRASTLALSPPSRPMPCLGSVFPYLNAPAD